MATTALPDDIRFTRPLYSTAEAARLVGTSRSKFRYWTQDCHGRHKEGTLVKMAPVVTALKSDDDSGIPFVGLVEATVVKAFREAGLSLQQIRLAIRVLSEQGEIRYALASKRFSTDGAQVLYEYANEYDDENANALTAVVTQQRVFRRTILDYLRLIDFRDEWASGLNLSITERPLLKVVPGVARGDPFFIRGGATLSSVSSRAKAGEPIASIAHDVGVPAEDITEAMRAIWPQMQAA